MSVGPDLGCLESVRDPTGYFGDYRDGGAIQWSDAQRGWAVIGHTVVTGAFRDRDALGRPYRRGPRTSRGSAA